MTRWLRDKWNQMKLHHAMAERLRVENVRLIAIVPEANLDQATVCLREIERKGSSSTHPKVKP